MTPKQKLPLLSFQRSTDDVHEWLDGDVDTELRDDDTRFVDLDRLIESRLLVQANSGGGKSTLIRYLLEQTH
jgi:hypothetical protein